MYKQMIKRLFDNNYSIHKTKLSIIFFIKSYKNEKFMDNDGLKRYK